jgi:fimbrial chaperone protein
VRNLIRAVALSVVIGVALLVEAAPTPADAAQFDVTPVEAILSVHNRSQLLTIQNNSSETMRLQLSAFGWRDGANGEPVLSPTDEIIFFPELFSLSPGESRKIRVGSFVPAEQTEKTYRLYISQLKPLETPVAHVTSTGPQIRVLLNIGIPIYIEPVAPSFQGEVDKLAMSNGVLSFELKNLGNLHFTARKMVVQGLGSDGHTIFSRTANGTRILKGDVREYQLPPIATTECTAARSIEIQIDTEQGQLKKSLPVTADACGNGVPSGAPGRIQ